MLKSVNPKKPRVTGGRFAIVASRYNARYVDAMLRAAKAELQRAGAQVQIVRVPGAYEIPVVARTLARQAAAIPHNEVRVKTPDSLSAIICLGVVFLCETVHAPH